MADRKAAAMATLEASFAGRSTGGDGNKKHDRSRDGEDDMAKKRRKESVSDSPLGKNNNFKGSGKGQRHTYVTPTGKHPRKGMGGGSEKGGSRGGTPTTTPGSSSRWGDFKSPSPSRMSKGIYESLPLDMKIGTRLEEEPSMRDLVEGIVGDLPSAVYNQKLNAKVLVVGKLGGKMAWKRKGGGARPLGGSRRANHEGGGGSRAELGQGRAGVEGEYGGMVRLHEMWKEHIVRLSRSKVGVDGVKQSRISAVLKSADLRGAMVVVVSAACPSSVGMRGIVTRETSKTVEVAGSNGRARRVAKEGTKLSVRSKDTVCLIDCSMLVGRGR